MYFRSTASIAIADLVFQMFDHMSRNSRMFESLNGNMILLLIVAINFNYSF